MLYLILGLLGFLGLLGKVPLFHKQNILKFLVSCTVLVICGFIYFDFKLALNPLIDLGASIFIAGFSVAIMKWVFATFPSTRSRIFLLAQLILGSALCVKIVVLAKVWAVKIGATAVFVFYTYLLGLFMDDFRKWGNIGNGPQPLGADMNAPVERWKESSIGLSCGPVAKAIDESVGHGWGTVRAPYYTVLPDGQIALKGSLWTVSDLMETGVEFQSAEDAYAHFTSNKEDFLFVYPKQLIGKSQAELDEINERLWEEAIRMYKANHECAERLRADFDKVIDAVHGVVTGALSFDSKVVGMFFGFINRCLNSILSLKLFVRRHEAFLRLQRIKLNAFHRRLMAKLLSVRQEIAGKLEAVRTGLKDKAHSFLSGYHWLGLYIGGTSLLPFWTCISFVLKWLTSQLKFKKRFGVGLFGFGTGWFDPVVPAHFLCDEEDFVTQTVPGFVKPVVADLTTWQELQLGWKSWAVELAKLWNGLMGYLKPLLEKLLALLKKLGGIFKRKQ